MKKCIDFSCKTFSCCTHFNLELCLIGVTILYKSCSELASSLESIKESTNVTVLLLLFFSNLFSMVVVDSFVGQHP